MLTPILQAPCLKVARLLLGQQSRPQVGAQMHVLPLLRALEQSGRTELVRKHRNYFTFQAGRVFIQAHRAIWLGKNMRKNEPVQ